MIVEYIYYTVDNTRAEEFATAYRRAGEFLSGSEHCLGWELRRSVERPDQYVVRLEWDSREGHEQGWRNDPVFPEFRTVLAPFSAGRSGMYHYELVHADPRVVARVDPAERP